MNQIVWKIHAICLTLWRVFHSIRFKVNKVGVRRYSFFCVCWRAKPSLFLSYFNSIFELKR